MNFIVIEQDEAIFEIDNAATDAEAKAQKIIAEYQKKQKAAKDAAQAAYPVRFSLSVKGLIGESEKHYEVIAEKMAGYSNFVEGKTETWVTPNGTLSATFLGRVGPYQNKFQFEIKGTI